MLLSMLFGLSIAFAEFPGLKKLPGGSQSSGSVSVSDRTASKDKAVTAYLSATGELTTSLEKAAEAFNVKKEVLEKLAVVKSLKEGNINDADLEKARKASDEANQIIKQKMEETKAPSAESKKLMAESMVHLALGIDKERTLLQEAKNLSEQAQTAVKSASPADIVKVKGVASTALALAKNIPMDVKLTKDIFSSYIQYAKANNISIPENATALLKEE
jgi:soluble cytochrome b562